MTKTFSLTTRLDPAAYEAYTAAVRQYAPERISEGKPASRGCSLGRMGEPDFIRELGFEWKPASNGRSFGRIGEVEPIKELPSEATRSTRRSEGGLSMGSLDEALLGAGGGEPDASDCPGGVLVMFSLSKAFCLWKANLRFDAVRRS